MSRLDFPPSYITIVGAADDKWAVARMEYDEEQDDWLMVDISSVNFTTRCEALKEAIEWADRESLEIR